MKSLPAFYFLEPDPLIKAMVKVKPVKLHLGFWKGLAIIAIGPRNGKIVGYRSDGKPIYAGSQAAEQLALIKQQKHTYTPAQQDVELVKWLQALGLQGAIDQEKVHLTKEGAVLVQSAFSVPIEPLGGGKWGVVKAHLLPHLGEPLKPSEQQLTSWAAEMASGEYKESVFPPLHTLKEIPAGKFAGSHGNQLFVDKSGKKWVFKPSDPTIARAEEAASRIGRLLLGDRIPASNYVQVKGKDGVLIQVLDGEVWQESSSEHSDPQLTYLKKYKDQVVQHEVLDWLVSNHDSHAGNFLANGEQLIAIDKGQAWKWIGEDKLSPSFKGNNPSYQIYHKFWQAVQQGKIDPKGLIEAAAKVVNRAEQISPEQFSLIVAPYVSTWAGGKGADPHQQLEKMLARLKSLRDDFEEFLSQQLHQPVQLPKPPAVQVQWDTPPQPAPAPAPVGKKEEPKPEPKPQPVQLPTPTAESPPKLQVVEQAPVSAAKPAAGWPLTKKGQKTSVTIVDPGTVPPATWPAGTPAPGLHLQCDYKGKVYSLIVQESLFEPGKPKFKVLYPDGKEETFKSLNAAGDSLYLFNQGMPLDMNATQKKGKGISLGSKVFQLKQFEKELSEAYGKAEEPVPVAVATPEQLEEQKVIEPEQKEVSVMGLLSHLPDGEVLTQGAPALPQEVKEFLAAYQGYDQLTTGWDLALTPGYAVKVTNPAWQTKNTMILTARLSKEGKPELWGWWEGLDGKLKQETRSGNAASTWEKLFGIQDNGTLADLKAEYLKAAKFEEEQKKQAAQPVEPAGAPPEVVLPENAEVPATAPKFTPGPLAAGTVIKVKKKVPGYDKKQEVTLTALQNGKLLVEIPGQTAQTFETLSAASDHVWVVQKGYADAADYKAKNKTNKVPSGGGWKFWGISPAAAPAAPGAEPGAGGAAVPAAPAPAAPAAGAPAEAPPAVTLSEVLGPKDTYDWQKLNKVTPEIIAALPAGTTISWHSHWEDGDHQAEKQADGQWQWTSAPNSEAGPFGLHPQTMLMQYLQASIDTGHFAKVLLPTGEDYQATKHAALVPEKEEPAVGGATVEFLAAAPVGTKIKTSDTIGSTITHTLYEKIGPDQWKVTLEGKTPIEANHEKVYGWMADEKIESWEGPGAPAVPGLLQPGEVKAKIAAKIKQATQNFTEFLKIPQGTKITTKGDSGSLYDYVKVSVSPASDWTVYLNGKLMTTLTAQDAMHDIANEEPVGWEEPGAPVPEKPDTAAQVAQVDKIKAQAAKHDPEAWNEIVKHLAALPAGIVLKTKSKMDVEYQYTKQADGTWNATGGVNATTGVPNGSLATDLAWENEAIVGFTPAGQDVPEKSGAQLPKTLEEFAALPVGTFVQTKSNWGAKTTYLKEAEDKWKITFESGEYHKYDDVQALGMINGEKLDAWSAGTGSTIVGTAAELKEKIEEAVTQAGLKEHLDAAPIGTVVVTKTSLGTQYVYTKLEPDQWKMEGGAYGTVQTGANATAANMLGEPVISVVLGEEKAPGEENWAWFDLHPVEAAAKVQPDIKAGGEQFDKLPAGTKIQYSTEKGVDAPLHVIVKKKSGKWDYITADGNLVPHANNVVKTAMTQPETILKQLVGPGKTFAGEKAPEKGEETASLEDIATALASPEGLKFDEALVMQNVTNFPKTPAAFEQLPIGTQVITVAEAGSSADVNTQWIYTKVNQNYWNAKKGKSAESFHGLSDPGIFSDIKNEKLLTFAIPGGAALPGAKPAANLPSSIASWDDLPDPVKEALKPVQANLKILQSAQPSLIEKPASWADWVPPPALYFKGVTSTGKPFYLLNSSMAYNSDGSVNHKVRFTIVYANGLIHTGEEMGDPIDALNSVALEADIGMDATEIKEALGFYGVTFPAGSTAITPTKGNSGTLKPVEQMTPAEKTAKVKVNMPLQQALKVHPGLKEGKLKIKKAKGSGMYICLDGVDGASTKLYTALQDLGVAQHIKNVGGVPKVNAKGAFVAVDSWILDQEVTVETTALDASSEQHAPGDPNWQTMPEATPKKKKQTKAQKAAEEAAKQQAAELKAKAAAIKTWSEQYPPVTDKAALQLLAYLQKDFTDYQIPIGVIARSDGGALLLSHKTHQKQFAYYLKLLSAKAPIQMEEVATPWGSALKVDPVSLRQALEAKFGVGIGQMISGPDGKQYPAGTTFQKKVSETTVEQLLPGEPGFYKIKEHKTEPGTLALLKISGNGKEQLQQMKAMIEKYGLEGPFPEPKVAENSVIHSVFKKSLQKVWKTEETFEATVPKQLPDFVPGSLPFVDTAGIWEEVGDGSGELYNIAAAKPSRFGMALRIGAPGELRDFCIRYRKVKDPAGQLYYEFTGDLVSFQYGKSELSSGMVKFGSTQGKSMSGLGEKNVMVMDYDPETGIHTEVSPDLEDGPDTKGFVGLTEGGSSVAVVPPSPSQDTMKNTFRVRIPVGLDPLNELRAAFQKMGKDPDKVLAPINEESDRIYKKAMLVRGLMGARGWNEDNFTPQLMHSEDWLDSQLAKFGAKSKVKDLRVVKTFDNQITVVADDAEKFKTWDFAYVGSHTFATLLQLLQGSGWSSRKNRLLHGIWNGGQSASTDFSTGGSKGTFFRIAGDGSHMHNSYECQIIVHPRVFQRTDWWRYNSDGYGNTSSHNHAGTAVSGSPGRYTPKLSSTNEVLFEGGVSAQDIVAVVVNNEDERSKMIAALKKAGRTELNGKPLDEVIILANHKGAYAYGDSTEFAKVLGLKKEGE